jgi:hypothetical protein
VESGIHPFIRSLDHYPGVRRATLSAAAFPAVGRGLFARGRGGFKHRALGGASLCLCRQRRGTRPDNGPGAGRLVGGSIEPPESDESKSLALCLPAAGLRAFWETAVPPPPAEPGCLGHSTDRLALAAV